MQFLCFTIKENKIAINITDIFKLIESYNLTHYANTDGRSVYIVQYLGYLIPVYEIHNEYKTQNKVIVVINSNRLFGFFVDNIDDIYKDGLPEGYSVTSKEELEIFIEQGRIGLDSDVELF